MTKKQETIQKLKDYFKNRDDVAMAFLFGSQAKGTAREISDWDVGVYLTNEDRTNEREIWGDVEHIVKSEVDLLVMNRARPQIIFTVLNHGISLALKDRRLYLKLLIKTQYEAIDFWQFVDEFWKIRERSHSLSKEDRATLIELTIFLEDEWKDRVSIGTINQHTYMNDRTAKRNIERWVENLVMGALDIAKTVLSSEGKQIPHTYEDTLRAIGFMYFKEQQAEDFAWCANMRNLVAHEYLDMRWERIQQFMGVADTLYPVFINQIKKFLEDHKKD